MPNVQIEGRAAFGASLSNAELDAEELRQGVALAIQDLMLSGSLYCGATLVLATDSTSHSPLRAVFWHRWRQVRRRYRGLAIAKESPVLGGCR